MEWNRMNGSGKGYYVTDHALKGSGYRYDGRSYSPRKDGPCRGRQWIYRRSVDGERHDGRNAYDIAEGVCYMADIEFDAGGAVLGIRYDLVRPAGKV